MNRTCLVLQKLLQDLADMNLISIKDVANDSFKNR